tara:strand:- start:2509 stop:2874 length:366 start_codon:yes stop_codon:yes gene_type:complete
MRKKICNLPIELMIAWVIFICFLPIMIIGCSTTHNKSILPNIWRPMDKQIVISNEVKNISFVGFESITLQPKGQLVDCEIIPSPLTILAAQNGTNDHNWGIKLTNAVRLNVTFEEINLNTF